ncbi:MAG: hypothetical protein R3C59_27535 [Planctomycetaceae bacterium]
MNSARRFHGLWRSPGTRYRANWIDETLLSVGIIPRFLSKEMRTETLVLSGFDKEKYRQRNIVERPIGWLKNARKNLFTIRKDGHQLRRNDQDGFHRKVPQARHQMTQIDV